MDVPLQLFAYFCKLLHHSFPKPLFPHCGCQQAFPPRPPLTVRGYPTHLGLRERTVKFPSSFLTYFICQNHNERIIVLVPALPAGTGEAAYGGFPFPRLRFRIAGHFATRREKAPGNPGASMRPLICYGLPSRVSAVLTYLLRMRTAVPIIVMRDTPAMYSGSQPVPGPPVSGNGLTRRFSISTWLPPSTP